MYKKNSHHIQTRRKRYHNMLHLLGYSSKLERQLVTGFLLHYKHHKQLGRQLQQRFYQLLCQYLENNTHSLMG